MNPKAKISFVWYATHPKFGDLTLVVPSDNAYRSGYIYAPVMIGERIGNRADPLIALELSVGPLGVIPRCYYEEAGFMIDIPFWLRMLVYMDENREKYGLPDEHLVQHDERIGQLILREWEKVYKSH